MTFVAKRRPYFRNFLFFCTDQITYRVTYVWCDPARWTGIKIWVTVTRSKKSKSQKVFLRYATKKQGKGHTKEHEIHTRT